MANEKCWRELSEELESKFLGKYATKSEDSLGRVFPEKKCFVRTEYSRDADRILYSVDFRRLRHKTQVFFNAQNDHICTRMEHVLYVASISNTIARALRLNTDLTNAIALGHDLGHAPFGHSGERVLNQCVKREDESRFFKHEIHSLRVVDRLATRVSREKINETNGLNLTFEVRDGIVCHCGENMEYYLEYNRNKQMKDIENLKTIANTPATPEACIVRLVDKIAYVGRDIEDAMRVRMMDSSDIPKAVQDCLGSNNGEIINTLVSDVINNSADKPYIAMSNECGEALKELIACNVVNIYKNDRIMRYENQVTNMVEGLFECLLNELRSGRDLNVSKTKVFKQFGKYIRDEYSPAIEKVDDVQMVTDFIAGMTDNFASKCFEEVYWM